MTQFRPFNRALESLIERCIDSLPNFLTAIALFLGGWLLARLAASASRHLARHLEFDQVIENAGWTEAFDRNGITIKPSEFVARLVFWSMLAVFVVLAAQNLGLVITALPLKSFLAFLPRMLGAVLLLFFGSAIAGVVSSGLGATLARLGFDQHKLMAGATRGIILLITLTTAIEHLGFDLSLLTSTLINLLTIFAAALGVTFALGGRDVARNLLAGYYARERFTSGDILQLEEGSGELVSIGTLTSEIRTESGSLVFPNSRLTDTAVTKLNPDTSLDDRT